MAEHLSTQITNLQATPRKALDVREAGARLRLFLWEFTTPAGGVAINDTIKLVRLPAGSRIVGGRVLFEAMSTGAGVATGQIGITGATTKYLEATSVDAAGQSDFADTIARNNLATEAAEVDLIATATVEAWAAAKKFNGYVLIVEPGS